MRMHMISLAATIAVVSAFCGDTQRALAQSDTYPNRLIKIIHQYTPGGGNDLIARIIASGLSERWHQSVIVEPRPGGGGIIGADAVAKAPPDGYTLLVSNIALSMLPSLGKPLPFDVPGSFAPIVIATTGQWVLVASNNAPYRSIKELIAYARPRPGEIPYSSVGVGSPITWSWRCSSRASGSISSTSPTRARHRRCRTWSAARSRSDFRPYRRRSR